MNVQMLEQRLSMLLSLLKDQEAKGMERETLQGLVQKIRRTSEDLDKARSSEDSDLPVVWEDGDDPDQPFKYGKPKKFKQRGLRRADHAEVKRSHPNPIPWHGRLA